MNGFHRLHALRMENDQRGFDMEEMRPRFERIAQRHENGSAPRAVVVYQLFQTPLEIAAQLVGLLNLRPGCQVLEPSAGLGNLIRAVLPFGPSKLTAVETAPQCAAELYRMEHEGLTLIQRDFLTVTTEEIGFFDAVLMNPPFHMRADIRHIKHAESFLRRGGRIAAICMDTSHRREAFHDWNWIELPPNAFRSSGTNVKTCIIHKAA